MENKNNSAERGGNSRRRSPRSGSRNSSGNRSNQASKGGSRKPRSANKPQLNQAQEISPKSPRSNNRQAKSRNNSNHKVNRNNPKPKSEPKVLKVSALSGTEEVGRNSNFIEVGEDIIMIDCGLAFPTGEHFGVDYIIPNTKYLQENKRKIRGILITHGHLDHIGALPYILPDLGFPTIYGSKVANDIIRARLAEFKQDKKARLVNVDESTNLKLGSFKISFIHVTHSIPGCHAIFMETPRGNVFVSGDYKMDTNPLIEEETNYAALAKLKGRVDLALMESTRAAVPGHSKTEYELKQTLGNIVRKASGRVVIASFASNISRMHIAGVIAKKLNKKVFVSGRSSLKMLELAKKDVFLKGLEKVFLPAKDMGKFADNQVIFLCTGSQGERYGALNRISLGEHPQFKAKKGDLIIRSSSDIPGNEMDIEGMTSRLLRTGADMINNREVEVHYGGHGSRDDMKRMFDLIKPKNVMPVHGHYTLRYFAKQNYLNWGLNEQNVLMTDDGAVWSSSNQGKNWKRGTGVPAKPVLVDGLGIGDIGDAVLKDREQLSEFGMVVTILNLSSKSKKLIGKPRFISRGFVYVKTSQDLFKQMEKIVRESYEAWHKASKRSGKFEYTKLSKDLEKKLGKLIYKKTEREPMLLTHIL